MVALIEAEFHDGDAAPIVAARIVGRLRTTDPQLLAGWLDDQASSILSDLIGQFHRSQRAHARAVESRGVFGVAAAAGDVAGFLELRYVVDAAHTRLSLAKMRAEHLVFVASGYEKTVVSARFEAAFFRALARKVGSGSVEDHFTNEQIVSLRASIR
jgi:hypothetical protein